MGFHFQKLMFWKFADPVIGPPVKHLSEIVVVKHLEEKEYARDEKEFTLRRCHLASVSKKHISRKTEFCWGRDG